MIAENILNKVEWNKNEKLHLYSYGWKSFVLVLLQFSKEVDFHEQYH